jgi:flagellar biosynthetic protein FliR
MSLTSVLLANASLFALVASRIGGFVVVSPFPGQNVGKRQRVGLVVVLAWVACAFAPAEGAPRSLGLDLVGSALLEVIWGVLIGVAFRLMFAAAEVLGEVLGLVTGLGTPSVLNPTLDAAETPIARVVGLVAMLIALAMGVHRVALAGLLESFRAIPVGTAAALDTPLLRWVELGIDAFVVGVRLATPIMAIGLLVHVALAMISRAAPSLQIFTVGFAILFVSTLATLLTCFDDIAAGLASHFAQLASVLDEALTATRR